MAKKSTTDEERPMAKMGTIDFRYDEAHDLIVATPHWNIETKEDVLLWFRQYEAYMHAFDRKMDFVVVLDDFTIGPAIGPFWGEYRAKVHQTYTRFNYRVHSNNRVKLFVNTSGARYSVSTEEAATVEDAIEAILAARERA
jgi:hypothetical protein